MATTRDLLNKVLIGLRKDEISSSTTAVTDAFHKLVLQFVNVAKEEVEEAWDWLALRTTVTVTGVAATNTYSLVSGSVSDTTVPSNSRLLYTRPGPAGTLTESSVYYSGSAPQVFDTTDTDEFRLKEVTIEEMERLHFQDNDEQATRPECFALYQNYLNIIFKVWPTPTGIRTWKLRFVKPQTELTAADITTVLTVPARPIWQRALVYQTQERGEELGMPTASLAVQADTSLASAIAREQTDADVTGYPQ